jgi:hypothetical protein
MHSSFRSESLDLVVSLGCTYASDIMVDSVMKRFIDGWAV